MAEMKKCAHVPCGCQTSEEYCSQACEEAGSDEVEIACGCGHASCPASLDA